MADEPNKNGRRWFRFRLRTLLIAWLALGAWLGWWVNSARQQRDAVAKIRTLAKDVFFDYSFQRLGDDPLNWRPPDNPNPVSWVPKFALNRLGVDYFHNVVAVNVLRGRAGNEIKLADELARLPNLEQLVLVYVDVTDEMMVRLVKCRDLTGLEFGGASDESLRLVSTLPKLQLLDTGGSISDAGLEHLKRLRTLKSLALESFDLTDGGVAHLAMLPNLKRLSISPLPSSTGWRDLRITNAGVAELQRLRDLEFLSIASARVTGAGIAKLAACKNLRDMSFRHCGITDADLQGFASFTSLEGLDLLDAKIEGNGFRHLTGLRNLRRLYLANSTTMDEAIPYLAQLPNLEAVDLDGTRVTAKGLEQFKTSRKLRRLVVSIRSPSLFGLIADSFREPSGLEPSDLAQLKAVLPRCRIDGARDF